MVLKKGNTGEYHAKIGGNMVIVHYYLREIVRFAEEKTKGGGVIGLRPKRMRSSSTLREGGSEVWLSRLDEEL